MRILHLIDTRGPELCVCDMIAALKLPQATVSRQLMLLRELGLVADRRDGKWNHYSLSRPSDKERAAILGCLRTCWAGAGKPFSTDLERFDYLHSKNAIFSQPGSEPAQYKTMEPPQYSAVLCFDAGQSARLRAL